MKLFEKVMKCYFAEFNFFWSACMCLPTSAAHPQSSSLAGLQSTQVLPHYTTPLHRLIESHSSYWFLPAVIILHPGHGQTTHHSPSMHSATAKWPATRGAQLSLNKFQTVPSPGSIVELALH